MTLQQAIMCIKKHNEIHSKKERNAIFITKALNMAVSALEKQIPKKPRITVHKYIYHGEEISANFKHCPCCFDDIHLGYFDTLVDKDSAYCRRCGQALDWSDDE